MKQPSLNSLIAKLRICIAVLILVILSMAFFSFTVQKMNDNFLKQLGIQKTEADKKISNSILGGYFNAYGLTNAKNIAVGNRAAVVRDLLVYTKQYVSSPAFKNEYETWKQQNKPPLQPLPETPGEMHAGMIKLAKEFVTQAESYVKNATPENKKIFESSLEDARKNLQDAEDMNNKTVKLYTQNYPELVKSFEASNAERLKEWELTYPDNQMLLVKIRLQEFLDETKDIDFSAALQDRNGKKIFLNTGYQRKSSRWKMAFRAGKEVVEPARVFVQLWLNEIK